MFNVNVYRNTNNSIISFPSIFTVFDPEVGFWYKNMQHSAALQSVVVHG